MRTLPFLLVVLISPLLEGQSCNPDPPECTDDATIPELANTPGPTDGLNRADCLSYCNGFAKSCDMSRVSRASVCDSNASCVFSEDAGTDCGDDQFSCYDACYNGDFDCDPDQPPNGQEDPNCIACFNSCDAMWHQDYGIDSNDYAAARGDCSDTSVGDHGLCTLGYNNCLSGCPSS